MIKEEVVVITGAAQGIGGAIAGKLASNRCVVLVDVQEPLLCNAVNQIIDLGGVAHSVVGDVALRETHVRAAELASSLGTLAGWVNCAGINKQSALHEFPSDSASLQRLIDVNQIGTLWGCSTALATFVSKKTAGAIVNISSIHGHRAWRDNAVYEMTKAAIDALTRNIAVTYGSYGIRANAIAPGAVLTPVLQESIDTANDPVAREATLSTSNPLKRIADVREIADVAEFLLSSASSYVSGICLYVDGGWSAAMGPSDLDPQLASRYGLDPLNGLKM